MSAPVYLVRMWQQRGRGAYVHNDAWMQCGRILDGRLTTKQKDARRFLHRDLAALYADAFGGRVVRLRERSGRCSG